VPGAKKAEEDATLYLIKDGTFFPLFCLTNPAPVIFMGAPILGLPIPCSVGAIHRASSFGRIKEQLMYQLILCGTGLPYSQTP
jgi:hypothetical protein